MPSDRITLQHLEPPSSVSIQPRDALFRDTRQPRDGNAPPAALLLDFMYGAAVYKRWGNGSEMKHVIHDQFVDKYQSIPILQKPVDPSSGEDSGSECSDPTDGNYVDPGFTFRSDRTQSRSEPHDPNYIDPGLEFQSNRAWRPRDSMIKAMDDMNLVMMRMSGITPEARAAQWQKEEEEKQLKDEEFSQAKVLEWIK